MDVFTTSRDQATRDSWKLIKRFLSDSWGKEVLIEKHRLHRIHHQNAAKQARQVRYCVSQAIEYFSALQQSTLSTAPLQLYYGAMSLALAEVLVRGSGDTSLDRARQGNSSHGLELVTPTSRLNREALTLLRARPQIRDGSPCGTFALWHKFAEYDPIYGRITEYSGETSTRRVSVLVADDSCLDPFPKNGVDLLSVYTLLPEMQFAVGQLGLATTIVRSTVSAAIRDINNRTFSSLEVICHPTSSQNQRLLCEQFKAEPRAIEHVRYKELASGFIFSFERESSVRLVCELPSGLSVADDLCYLYSVKPALNEFGCYYVGAFILGNLCRYFPDIWMESLDRRSDFMFLADAFLESAIHRVPMRIAQSMCNATFSVKEMSI